MCSCGLIIPLTARFMGPTWGPSGADRTQVGPMLAPWILLSGSSANVKHKIMFKVTIMITGQSCGSFWGNQVSFTYWLTMGQFAMAKECIKHAQPCNKTDIFFSIYPLKCANSLMLLWHVSYTTWIFYKSMWFIYPYSVGLCHLWWGNNMIMPIKVILKAILIYKFQ